MANDDGGAAFTCAKRPNMPFEFVIHDEDRILEVIYPASPAAGDVTDYTTRVRAAIDSFGGQDWSSLVDQSELQVLPPDLLRAVTQMNLYAANHGMVRTARVVADAASGLQAWKMGKAAGLSVPIQTFPSREEAVDWIRAETGLEE